MAFTVAAAFEQLCKNLRFSDDNLSKISNRYHSITKRINTDYWETSSDSAHSLYVGSYGQYILGKPANGLGNRAIYQPAAS